MVLPFLKGSAPVPSCGILTVVILSCVLFGVQNFLGSTPGILSVGASVFFTGRVHGLVAYSFYHQTPAQLCLSLVALVFLCGSLEKGFGTVRFLFSFSVLSTTTGLLYSLEDLLLGGGQWTDAEGLIPAVLACVTLTITHTKVTKGFLCGISFPRVALPWVLLAIASFAPRSRLPCNITAVLVGWMHGKGWFSLVDLSEAKAGVLEKMTPFRLLRRIGGVTFVPASAEERRRTILPQIKPTPGSYPVQAYAPLSSLDGVDSTARFYEGWPNGTGFPAPPKPPSELKRQEDRCLDEVSNSAFGPQP